MTDDKDAPRELPAKGSDAGSLREMIGFAAQRLMELETEALCGAAHGERSPARRVQRDGYRDRDWDERRRPFIARARSNCASVNADWTLVLPHFPCCRCGVSLPHVAGMAVPGRGEHMRRP